jgi:hypothetical protein
MWLYAAYADIAHMKSKTHQRATPLILSLGVSLCIGTSQAGSTDLSATIISLANTDLRDEQAVVRLIGSPERVLDIPEEHFKSMRLRSRTRELEGTTFYYVVKTSPRAASISVNIPAVSCLNAEQFVKALAPLTNGVRELFPASVHGTTTEYEAKLNKTKKVGFNAAHNCVTAILITQNQ